MAGVLLALPILALLVGAALVVPLVVQPTVPFGVRVPPDRVGSPLVMAEQHRYRLLVLAAGGGIAVAAVAVAALTGLPAVTPVAVIAMVGVMLAAYARAHVAIAAAKQREHWYADLSQEVVVDTSLRTSPERFPWAWAIPSPLLLVATIAIGVVRYPQLPASIPVHFGVGGTADAFAPRSIGSAFSTVIAQAVVTVLIVGSAWLWLRARPDLDPRRPAASARQHRAWIGGMTRAMLAVAACANVTFLLISVNQWWYPPPGGWSPLLAVVPLVASVAALLVVAVRTTRRERAPAAGGDGGPVARDDDRFWIGGLLYWNRDDPALVVPRRFGVGLTLNLGNVRAWLILAVLALLLAVPIALRHR